MPITFAQVTPGIVPAALGAAPVRSVKPPLPPPPKVRPVRSSRPPPPPPPKFGEVPQKQTPAAELVAQGIAAQLATAGQVAGAIFNDAVEERGLPTPLQPQPATLSITVGGPAVSFGTRGPSAPTAATFDDAQVPVGGERKLVLSLDPEIEDDVEGYFQDDGPMGPILPGGLSPLRESDMEF